MSREEHSPAAHSIAVVGAGIIGLSLAWRLAQAGWRVTVFEQGAAGREASWAGAGMLSPGGEIDTASRLASLALESAQRYPAFVQELERASGHRIDYQPCGGLDLAYSEAEWLKLEERAARQTTLGINSKVVPLRNVRQFWPRIRTEGLAGARFYPGDAIVNPRQVVEALQVACQECGVLLRTECRVTGAAMSDDAVLVRHSGRSEAFTALAIAAGAWSNGLAVTGVPPLPAVEPVKGHLIGYVQPDQTCNTILRWGHTYLLQRANGLLIAGASVERAGFNREIQPVAVDRLIEQAGAVLPHLAETTPTEVWIGFRPGSEELRLGAWHSERLYLAYGHYRNGILLAPVTAEKVAAEINASFGRRSLDRAELPEGARVGANGA